MNLPHNPLLVAEKATQLAQKSEGADCKVFQKVAMISMITLAATGAAKMLIDLLREFHHHKDSEHGKGR